ncbi:MAG: serine/threonine-protein kinase [Acidimicrobiales bacterium]
MDLPPSIGRYRVTGVIGAGGFATVYRAVDDRLDSTVAVKVLAENHCHDPDVRERFVQEGRVLRLIDGRHVVGVHDLGETERGQPYLVLAHADRGTLADRVARRRAEGWVPTANDVRSVARTVADALGSMHAASVVHRDLTPRNLLLRSVPVAATQDDTGLVGADEELIVADLGLSKDLATASGLTTAGGTSGFASPEQRRGPTIVDARTDLWSASALVVWLLTGDPPDDDGTWVATVRTLGWPDRLASVLVGGLDPDPARRPSDAGAWFDAVDAALGEPAAPVTASSVAPGTSPARRSPLVFVAVGILVGILVTIAAALGLSSGGDDDPDATRTELADGRARVEVGDGALSVAVVGPTEIVVGEPAVFVADHEGASAVVWIGPDGRLHPDVESLQVTASSTGRTSVRLLASTSGGDELVARFEVRVVDP